MYDATADSGGGGVSPGGFPDDVLRALSRRLFRFGGLFAGLLEAHDHGGVHASLSEVMALGELADAEELSQSELADLLSLEKSTISRLVAGMEQRGWITRDRDPANRRYSRLRLTPAGRGVARRVGDHFRAHHQALLGALTPDERDALITGLTALIRVLDRHEHPPATG